MYKYLIVACVFLFVFSQSACKKKKNIDVNLNFKLEYKDQPLVMLDVVPVDGFGNIKFNRFSMYLSDIKVSGDGDTEQLTDVEFINLTNSHLDINGANLGYDINYTTSIENIDNIGFNIGLTELQNGTEPADYTSDSPLAKSGEYWISWDSYVFVKLEGFIDLDGDDEFETGVSLHLGSDAVRIAKEYNVNNDTNQFSFSVDLFDILQKNEVYDIATTPQIHSLNQIEQALILRENLASALKLNN